MNLDDLNQLAIALGLGLLVGLQRQWAKEQVAGIRTFTLITLLGTLCGLLAGRFGGWMVGAGLASTAALLVLGNILRLKRDGQVDPGMTTEVAALVMFTVGAALAGGFTAAAIAVGGAVAVLLHWKQPLHHFVASINAADLRAVVRLALIGLVVLPLLPDRTFGPYDVLNPFKIWLMVVLIVGISLGAYIAYKLLGARVGVPLAGLLGGLISSTATTVSSARRSRDYASDSPAAAVVVLIASAVVFFRLLLEIAVVAPGVWPALAPPLVAMAIWMVLLSLVMFFFARDRLASLSDREAPSNLTAAIVFGLLYAAVLLGIAIAKEHFGQSGLYTVAVLSGLMDMDAITLSTAHLVDLDRLPAHTGWRLILVASLANIFFKWAAVALLGHRRLLAHLSVGFGLAMLGGVGLVMLWPG